MRALGFILGLLAITACPAPATDGPAKAEAEEPADARPDLSFTDWQGNSELFIELPALVRGLDSPCAAHVTRLEPFSALGEGRVTVVLRMGGRDERFAALAPTVPGIFRPIARPTASGTARLLVEIAAPDLTVTHDLGDVVVHADVAAAQAAAADEEEPAGRIVFLKEQQWVIDFGTAAAERRPMRPTLRANGRIVARSDGNLEMTAPVAGRITSREGVFPQLGSTVAQDDVLAVIAPRLEAADQASLDLAVTSSTLELRFAERERERLEALRKEGAVPERRVLDAMHVQEEARAALATANKRLQQFRRAQRTASKGETGVALRAPLSGTITEVDVAPGSFVEAGASVLRIVDPTKVWLEARVPEVDVARVGTPRGASATIEGYDTPIELGPEALVSRGTTVDDADRTLPVRFAFDNSAAKLPIGAFARVALVTAEARTVLAVPELAVVDDGGAMVVFVQLEGEAFERRIVRTGLTDRGFVEILSGIEEGEHVVSVGAWSVKLAASSGTVPAHGHAH